MTNYLGVDPGETHGLFELTSFNGMVHSQVAGNKLLYETLKRIQPELIICEDFDRREKPGRIVPILKAIGVVELYAEQDLVPLEFQSAQYGKGWWDNGKLKQVKAYRTGMRHANDAARHVLQYVTTRESNFTWVNMLDLEALDDKSK